jgi:hypothetical protein
MRRHIVEGEPGIFPDPIARALRALARLLDRRRAENPANEPPAEDGEPPQSP